MMKTFFAAALLLATSPALSQLGVPDALGFPGWSERVEYAWTNRARSDPQAELAGCSLTDCSEKACYAPVPPLPWDVRLSHASRFHSDELVKQSYFAHTSACTVVVNIASIYPSSCDASASCACLGGTQTCNPVCTPFDARIALFGPTGAGEIINGTSEPNDAFNSWVNEHYSGGLCGFQFISASDTNGHRWNILAQTGSVGYGANAAYLTGDFAFEGTTPTKLVSGAHYPQQAASIDFWASWYDTAGPMSASVVIDGCPQTMALTRGSATNGAYKVTVTGLGSGCHRYYFSFNDSMGTTYTYPDTGSYAVGTGGGCPDYDVSRPSDTPPVVTAPASTSVTQTLCQ